MHWLGVFRGVEVKQDQLLGWFPDAGGGGEGECWLQELTRGLPSIQMQE